MRRVLLAALATTAIGFATPASAALTVEGITYNLVLNSITNGGLTGNYTLQISGINVAGPGGDTKGGRTGVNGFAFNNAAFATSGTSTGFTFQLGGLNSSGCNGNGAGFFCFKNTSATFPSPLPSSLALNFSVTSNAAGSWDNWAPHLKIDWTGSANNYDLVSQAIPVSTSRPPVPEPATWAMMLLGFGGIGMAMRYRRRSVKLPQIA